MIAINDVTALLSAQHQSVFVKGNKNVSVTNWCGDYVDSRFVHCLMKTRVRHHRYRNRIRLQLSSFVQVHCSERNEVVAIHNVANMVNRNYAVSVAIKCKT